MKAYILKIDTQTSNEYAKVCSDSCNNIGLDWEYFNGFQNMSGNIEVKSRRLNFSEKPSSYPKSTAFVDTEFGWKLKDPLPLAVVLVSQETGSLLVIPISSMPTWTTTRRFDNVRKIEDTFLLVNKKHLKPWSEFVDWLNVRQEKHEQKNSA